MCILGSAPDDCSDCIKKASDGLLQSFPNQIYAFSWPSEPTLCHVRYSNTSFSGSADLDPRLLVYNTGNINSNLTDFTAIWGDLVVRTIAVASTARSTPSSNNNHFTADVAALTPFQNIYALMQCTPDLSSGDCDSCLRQSVSDYQLCCGQKQGGVVMRPSCFFSWDLYTFSKAFGNITVNHPPVTVPQPPSNSAGDRDNTSDNNDCKGISAGVVVVIAIQTVVIILILFVLGLVLFRRRNSSQRTSI